MQEKTQIGKVGVNLLGLSKAAEDIGFRTHAITLTYDALVTKALLPCIVHWEQNHFIVVTPNSNTKKIEVADPAHGIIQYNKEEFCDKWLHTSKNGTGFALLLEPTPEFYNQTDSKITGISWSFLTKYLLQYKRYFFQLIFGLLIASVLQLIFPFLTQSIVDVGINTRNLHYIYLILFAQIFLFAGLISTEFIRSHILLYIGTRINISILSDFWIKLMKLPLSYFDTKRTGDTLQGLIRL